MGDLKCVTLGERVKLREKLILYEKYIYSLNVSDPHKLQ